MTARDFSTRGRGVFIVSTIGALALLVSCRQDDDVTVNSRNDVDMKHNASVSAGMPVVVVSARRGDGVGELRTAHLQRDTGKAIR
jgi:hypothetical protein